jgi:hypothetical protein
MSIACTVASATGSGTATRVGDAPHAHRVTSRYQRRQGVVCPCQTAGPLE